MKTNERGGPNGKARGREKTVDGPRATIGTDNVPCGCAGCQERQEIAMGTYFDKGVDRSRDDEKSRPIGVYATRNEEQKLKS